MTKPPATYLTCPFCPAQAYPEERNFLTTMGGAGYFVLFVYKCPAKHEFWVKGEEVDCR